MGKPEVTDKTKPRSRVTIGKNGDRWWNNIKLPIKGRPRRRFTY